MASPQVRIAFFGSLVFVLLFFSLTVQARPLPESRTPRTPAPSQAGATTRNGKWLGRTVAGISPAATSAIDVLYYGLALTPGTVRDTLAGSAWIQIEIGAADVDSIRLDAVQLAITAVYVNGAPRGHRYTTDSTAVTVQVGSAAPGDTLRQSGDVIWVQIDYGTAPRRGFYVYPRNAYTLSEPEDARFWFPCVDEPRDKARFECWITVSNGYFVGSNGVLISAAPVAPALGPGQPAVSPVVWHWREDHPIATYLMCITLGDYQVREEAVDGLPLLYLVFPEDVAKSQVDFENVPAMVRYFSGLYGPYPFDKYGMAAVVPFPYGGMEHQSLTTITRSWLRGDKTYEEGIAHELSHQWFGDLVTPKGWNEIWLNEGFATYHEALWDEHTKGVEARNNRMTNAASTFIVEYVLSRYPITDPPEDFIFTPTVYDKGAWILHMLRHEVGDPVFFDILRQYLDSFAYGNVTSADFQATAETVSGQDLDWFFQQWVYEKGYPVFEYSFDSERDGTPSGPGIEGTGPWTVHLHLRQTQASIDAPLFRVPMEIAVRTVRGEQRFSVMSTAAQEEYAFQVDAQPTDVRLDPDGWVLKRVVPHSSTSPEGEPSTVQVQRFYPNPVAVSGTLELHVPHLGPFSTVNGE